MTAFSKRFSFRAWSFYDDGMASGDTATLHTHTVPAEATYVHILHGAPGEQPDPLFTVWVDEKGEITVVDTPLQDDEDAPISSPVPGNKPTFLRSLANETVHHYFYGASFRLDSDGLKELCKAALDTLPPVDLGNEKYFVFANDLGGHQEPASVPILDPMAIALGYAKHSLAHHDELFNRYLADKTVLAKLIVGRQLTSLLRDPELKSTLSDELDTAAMDSELKSIQDTFSKLAEHRSVVADKLVDWLQTPAFEFAERCYREQEKDQYHDFLAHMGTISLALRHSAQGRKLLNSWLSDPPYFIQAYLPKSKPALNPGDDIRNAVLATSGVSENLFKIWQAMPYGIGSGEQFASHIEEIINRFNSAFGAGQGASQPIVVMREFGTEGLRMQPNESAQWAPWVKNSKQLFNRLGDFCSLLGGVVAVQALTDDKSSPLTRMAAGHSLTGATLGAVKTFGKTSLNLSSAATKTLGVVGGLASIVSDTFSAVDASQSGDGSKAAGHGLSAAAVIFWGAALVLTGSAAAIFLTAGIIVAVGGLALTTFTADSELEAFAKHCFWGKRFGLDTNNFAGTKLSEWKNNPQLQIEALLHIIFGFTVADAEKMRERQQSFINYFERNHMDDAAAKARRGGTGIEVIYGAVLEDSRFHMEWTLTYDDGPDFVTHFELNPGKKQLKELTGAKLEEQTIQWLEEDGEKPKVIMELPWEVDGPDFLASGRCRVWLDIDAAGQQQEPSTDNAFVPWNFKMVDGDFRPDDEKHSVNY